MRGRVASEVAQRAGTCARIAVHARGERRVGLDLRPRSSVALAARGEHEVVALAPDRHRRAADDVVRPAEPGHEKHQRPRPSRRREQPLRRAPRAHQRCEHAEQRNDEDEDRAHERKRCAEAPARGPPTASVLPGTREDVEQRRARGAGQRLAQHERDVVLRPRVDRVDEAGEQPEPLAPPAAHGERSAATRRGRRARPDRRSTAVVAAEDRALTEQREVRAGTRWTEDLSLGRLPRAFGQAGAGDVESARRKDEVEPGLQRRRIASRPGSRSPRRGTTSCPSRRSCPRAGCRRGRGRPRRRR